MPLRGLRLLAGRDPNELGSTRKARFRLLQETRQARRSHRIYDHRTDPHEWHNLAGKPEMASVLEQHRKFLPENEKGVAPGESTGHNAYAAAGANLQ